MAKDNIILMNNLNIRKRIKIFLIIPINNLCMKQEIIFNKKEILFKKEIMLNNKTLIKLNKGYQIKCH